MPLAAARYLSSIDGDITSASLTLVNPSPAAASAGNSRAGSRWIPVRSETVLLYSTFVSRRITTGPGSPRFNAASASRHAATQRRSSRSHCRRRLRASLGRHFTAVQGFGEFLPDLGIAPEVGHRRIDSRIEVSLVLLRRVAAQAELLDDGLDLALEVPAQGLERRRLRGMGRGQKGKAAERRDQTLALRAMNINPSRSDGWRVQSRSSRRLEGSPALRGRTSGAPRSTLF